MSSENSQVTSAASKLSGLKAPSKIVRPTPLQKPIPTASVASSTPLSSSSLLSEVSLFKVGDRVIVNGNKSGVVAFIGEAKFKEGEWAGVILDTTDGKNNGTVDGIQYFQTDENRGIFCRLNKLAKVNENNANTSINEPAQTPAPVACDNLNNTLKNISDSLTVGERVIVNSSNGAKKGYLRYTGTTEFAKGEWAGVELDEKLGKNDGSVNGKRYFKCEAMFGVFAPIQKVERLIDDDNIKAKPNILGTPAARSLQTASLKPKAGAVVTLKKELSGSQESINSMTSERSNISVSASQKSSALKRPSTIKPKMGVTVVSFLSFRLKFLFYFNFYLAKYSSKCLNFCCYRKKSTFN